MKKTRTAAVIVFTVLILSFLILSANHACDGDHCAVCFAISAAGTAIPAAALPYCFAAYTAAGDGKPQSREVKIAGTPVSAHVLDLN